MFIVMTVQTQQLPVAAVGRIVVMIVIFVMNREFTQFILFNFPCAPGADPWEKFERPFSIALCPLLLFTPGFGNDLILC